MSFSNISTTGDDRPLLRGVISLDPTTRARVEISLARLSSGNVSAVKGVGSGVSELRLDFGGGYRIYLAWHAESYVLLLGGGSKKRQHSDIAEAKLRWQDYKQRGLKKI